ncbi:MAG: transglutaminase-like domain-containing protein [Solirubrobacteraceae bacterium]|nr:transglutaminase-like domain-containing protein [Solirubrobacteraceae bacterium]
MTRAPVAWALALAFVLVAAGWWPLAGASVLWATPAVAVAVVVALRRWPARRAVALAAAWPAVACALAEAPWAALRPGGWDDRLWPGLQDGATSLERLAQGGPANDPWTAAVLTAVVGSAWIVAATVAVRAPCGRSIAATLVVLPWTIALGLREGDVAPWQGALVAAVVLAWLASRAPGPPGRRPVGATPARAPARGRVLAPGLVVALLLAAGVAVVAQAAAPRDRWLAIGALLEREAPVRRLDPEPSYGPLQGRRTGSVMFTVRADRPALWRMQVLERVNSRGWGLSQIPDALRPSEPAGVREEIDVEVDRSRDQLLLGAGRITGVDVGGRVPEPDDGVSQGVPTVGEGRRLLEAPSTGTTYRVRSRVVRPSVDRLEVAPDPSDELRRWTGVTSWLGRRWVRPGTTIADPRPDPSDGGGRPTGPATRSDDATSRPPAPATRPDPSEVASGSADDRGDGRYGRWVRPEPPRSPLFGEDPDPAYEQALGWGRTGEVLALARRVTAGSRNQLEAVRKVHRFLLEGDRFRYDTDLPEAGRNPLAEFLLDDRVGYCQHFAGGAALMLRLVGVPTRVVSGYATGTEVSDGVYEVRDTDAHQWIEVYFVGIGWVPFDPTPAADAVVDDEVDPLRAASAAARDDGDGGPLPLVAIVTAVGLVGVGVRRVRGGRGGDADAHRTDPVTLLARRAGVAVGPGTTHDAIADRLRATVGPRTAALARTAGRAAFAPEGAAPADARPSIVRVARAVRADVGAVGAVRLLVTGRVGPATR